ncbi:hypothetical protein MIND_00181600 [Mycena indigotica]|uniref:F-box domain-containing protein n=1 Tax=Mycena indigotica TaxID=2126181 RepID=A0A8H6WBD9_9AGAR|nr:uncharacterized protein MIND_00181600 [Mycena indigotica]KAF7311717.1 hypothetical protein MIND_00181600 [Mycena indigotica]
MSFAKLPAELLSEIAAYCPAEHTAALRSVNKMMSGVMAPAFFSCLPLMLSPEGLQERTRTMLRAVARGKTKTGWGKWAGSIRMTLRGADEPIISWHALVVKREPAARAAQDERNAFLERRRELERKDLPLLRRALKVLPGTRSASFEWDTMDLPHGVIYAILKHLRAAGSNFQELKIALTGQQGGLDKRPDISWPTFDHLRSLTLESPRLPETLAMLASYLCDAGSTRAISRLVIRTTHQGSGHLWEQFVLGHWDRVRELCVSEETLLSNNSQALKHARSLEALQIVPRPPRSVAEGRRWEEQLSDADMAAHGKRFWTALTAGTDQRRIRLKELRVSKLYGGLTDYLLSYEGLEVLIVTNPSGAALPKTIPDSQSPATDASELDDEPENASSKSKSLVEMASVDAFFDQVVAKHASSLRILQVTSPYAGRWSFGRHNAHAIRQLSNLHTLVMSVDVERVERTLKAVADREDDVNAVEHFLGTIGDLPSLRYAALLGTVPLRRQLEHGWDSVVSASYRGQALCAVEVAVEQSAPGQLTHGAVLFAGRNVYCQKTDGTYGVLETLGITSMGPAEVPPWAEM